MKAPLCETNYFLPIYLWLSIRIFGVDICTIVIIVFQTSGDIYPFKIFGIFGVGSPEYWGNRYPAPLLNTDCLLDSGHQQNPSCPLSSLKARRKTKATFDMFAHIYWAPMFKSKFKCYCMIVSESFLTLDVWKGYIPLPNGAHACSFFFLAIPKSCISVLRLLDTIEYGVPIIGITLYF